jgi:hypothetical protein
MKYAGRLNLTARHLLEFLTFVVLFGFGVDTHFDDFGREAFRQGLGAEVDITCRQGSLVIFDFGWVDNPRLIDREDLAFRGPIEKDASQGLILAFDLRCVTRVDIPAPCARDRLIDRLDRDQRPSSCRLG